MLINLALLTLFIQMKEQRLITNSATLITRGKRKQIVTAGKIAKQARGIQSIEAIPSNHQPWYHFYTKGDKQYENYMSKEWSIEKRGNVELFEKLSLEGAQAGLSWRTILKKRDAYRRVFHNFQFDKVSIMNEDDVEKMISSEETGDNAVVKHRGKLLSVINNAKKVKAMVDSNQSFNDFLWSFVDDKPILNSWKCTSDMPSKTSESERMSKELKRLGFKFVGPTTCYSLMQSCGMVIDHPAHTDEWRDAHERLKARPGGFQKR